MPLFQLLRRGWRWRKIHHELLSLIMMVVVMEITYLVMMMLMLTYLEAMMTMMTMMIAKAITAMNMISKLSIILITSLEVTKWKWKKEVKLSNMEGKSEYVRFDILPLSRTGKT